MYEVCKWLCDEVASIILLTVLLPLFAVIALMIKMEDGGNILHKRYCVGKNNKTFIMYKFRSMCADADNIEKYFHGETLKRYLRGEKKLNDPRITRTGKFLRKTSLDELPQLISVLAGNMSLVGPRPVIEREAEYYGSMRGCLLSVKPGITGWWQINGRDDLAYLSEESKALQLYYVFNRSMFLDAKILVKTIWLVIKKEGAR